MQFDTDNDSKIRKRQALYRYRRLKKQKQLNLHPEDDLFVQNIEVAMHIWGVNFQSIEDSHPG